MIWYVRSFFGYVIFCTFFPGGISRRMVRTPPGTFPLTDFTGQELNHDDEKFVSAPVKKGISLVSFNSTVD